MTRLMRAATAAALSTAATLTLAAGAHALPVQLPPTTQVNDDPGNSIFPDQPAGVSDVVGGSLAAGGVNVPWATFEQKTDRTDAQQIFVRAFKNGQWTTQGFPASLNIDTNQKAEAPSIDFAGTGRTVPWVSWYEPSVHLGGAKNIFASRFDSTQNKWVFAGQGRDTGGVGTVPVPSLNINTGQDAENPSVAGGSAVDPTKPGPWVAWQETSTANGKDQIFVSRPEGPGMTNCDGVKPAGVNDVSGHVPAVGGFCFQQTGIPRVGSPTLDPSLNVDPARDGIEPDIAFTGAQDAVPWVVWYETGAPGSGLQGPNGMVFAAKGVANASADGGFEWQAFGNSGTGVLDTSAGGLGSCSDTLAHEAGCSLNISPTADAEDPRVASGTMNPANPTVPWVVWDENTGTHHQVFVSRLVGVGAAARFVPVNGGQPISPAGVDSVRADITFSGNTPYVTYRTDDGGTSTTTVGHFVNAANPTFVVDKSDVPTTPLAQADVRAPISSGCTANPFNADGATCQGGALGTPFFLHTNGTSPRSLFADAYQPDAPVTGTASAVGQTTATISGSVNPEGARASVSFQFGTTTAYGQSTAAQTTGPDNAADAFSAALTGLPVGTTIHYRAVATTDFGTQVGADQTLTTQSPPPVMPGKASVGHAHVSGTTASVPVTCKGDTSCKVSLKLTVIETHRGRKLVAVSARKGKLTHKTVVVGTASATIKAGRTATVRVGLNRTGRQLLAARHKITAKLTVVQGRRAVSTQKVTFKAPKHRGKHGGR